MPRLRRIKTLMLEATVFVAFAAVIGHISMNFWERHLIQSELSEVKASLHFLKTTVNNIGTAYDKFYEELKGLAEVTENKQSLLQNLKRGQKSHRCNMYTLDRRKLHDIRVAAVIEANNALLNFPSKSNNSTEKNLVKTETKNVAVSPAAKHVVKNMTTKTCPPKSIGASYHKSYSSHRDENGKRKCCDHHKCWNNPFLY